MSRNLLFPASLVVAVALSAATTQTFAAGGDNVPTIEVPLAPLAENLHVFGATLGADWAGFPPIAQLEYDGPGVLDVTLPIYIDWELHVNVGPGCPPPPGPSPTQVIPPRPLASEGWFAGHHEELFLFEAPIHVDDTNLEYTSCPTGRGVEEPSEADLSPVTADGYLRIRDVHGGTAIETRIALVYQVESGGLNPAATYLLLIRWNRPQSYTDIVTDLRVDAAPGMAVRRPYDVTIRRSLPGGGYQLCGPYEAWQTVYIVEHVSTDASFASRGFVDAADIATLAQFNGHPVIWGFDDQGGPSARNFHCNFAPGAGSSLVIDASDLAKLATELTTHCLLGKAGVDERSAILDWFGLVTTGSDVVTGLNGETSPEYRFSDPAKLQRATADPYGYRVHGAGVNQIEWGRVKRLYR